MDNIAAITLCNEGVSIAKQITAKLGGDLFVHNIVDIEDLKAKRFDRVIALTEEIFSKYQGLIYIMPSGVVTRAVAPLVKSKFTDPAVVVMDILGRYAISFLSGHEGGANGLAIKIGNITGAEPIITTTTEVVKQYTMGIGCKKGIAEEAVLEIFKEAVMQAGITKNDIRYIATIDIKSDEKGLLTAAKTLEIPLRIISSSEIKNTCFNFDSSEFVQKSIGVSAVAEPAALLSGRRTKLVLKRICKNGVTAAIAKECSE